MTNSIKLTNKGETVTYKGAYKGWRHHISEYHLELMRGNKVVESIATGKNASASFTTHLKAALNDRLTFRDVKIGTVNDITVRMNPLDCHMVGINGSHGIYNDGAEDLWLFFTNQPLPGVTGWGTVDNVGDNLSGREINWSPK